jgi:hypothetical protein
MTQSEIIEQKNALYSERNTLESQLSSDDYKTIKNAEAQAAGKPLPYDPDALHAKHQAWRDRINEIEDEIKRLDAMKPDDEEPSREENPASFIKE